MMDNSAIHPPAIDTKIKKNSLEVDQKKDVENPFLDTLAQLRKNIIDKLDKRAKSKYITLGYLLDLIDLKSELEKSYWNTYHCVKELIYDAEKSKLTGKYCNNRWCLVCNRIRTGKLINGYFAELSKFEKKYFVTLTIPNVPGEHLKTSVKGMKKTFRQILDVGRKRKMILNGIRKMECTYNFKKENFHPHFHLIVDGKEQAEFIVSEWLNRYSTANRKAQDIRIADENKIRELFKYFTKIVSKQKEQDKFLYPVFIKPLDVMNISFRGMRVFQSFGKVKSQSEDVDSIQAENLDSIFEGNIWEWVQDQSDWVSEYGELLTENDYNKKITVITK